MRVASYSLSLLICFGLFFLTIQIKGDVGVLLKARSQLAQGQQNLKEDLRVLRAEYAHLSTLPRLTQLATEQGLQPLHITQLKQWSIAP